MGYKCSIAIDEGNWVAEGWIELPFVPSAGLIIDLDNGTMTASIEITSVRWIVKDQEFHLAAKMDDWDDTETDISTWFIAQGWNIWVPDPV